MFLFYAMLWIGKIYACMLDTICTGKLSARIM